MTLIDGATNYTTTVPATQGSAYAIALDPITNKIYVGDVGGNNVTVIDGATNSTTTVPVGTVPNSVAVNPVTKKIYVGNLASNNLTVIDGLTNSTTTLSTGPSSQSVVVNQVTNTIYVNDSSGNVTVIDGATNNETLVTAAGSSAMAVDPITNQIFVANQSSKSVTIITPEQLQQVPPGTAITPLPGNETSQTSPSFTSDLRALQTFPGASTRIASAYTDYYRSSFSFKVNVYGGNSHQVALYLLDWDTTQRVESVTITDASTGAVLNTETFSGFHHGEYAVWDIKGNVVMTVTPTAGPGAAVSGIFFN